MLCVSVVAKFNLFCTLPHSVFKCFIRLPQQREIFPYTELTDCLIMEKKCVFCAEGTEV